MKTNAIYVEQSNLNLFSNLLGENFEITNWENYYNTANQKSLKFELNSKGRFFLKYILKNQFIKKNNIDPILLELKLKKYINLFKKDFILEKNENDIFDMIIPENLENLKIKYTHLEENFKENEYNSKRIDEASKLKKNGIFPVDDFNEFHENFIEFIMFGLDKDFNSDLSKYFKQFKLFNQTIDLPQRLGNVKNIDSFDFKNNTLKINLNKVYNFLSMNLKISSENIDNLISLYDHKFQEIFYIKILENQFFLRDSIFGDVIIKNKIERTEHLEIEFNYLNNLVRINEFQTTLPSRKKISFFLINSDASGSFNVLYLKLLKQ